MKLGGHLSEEHKINISNAHKGKKWSEEKRLKMNIINAAIMKKTRTNVTCACCGKEFETRLSSIKQDRGKYCSRSCIHKGEKGETAGAWKGGKIKSGFKQAYSSIRDTDHPRAHNGYVLEHILVAEKALQKHLPAGAVVHHINGNTTDNSNGNFVICQDQRYHLLLHKRQRTLSMGGI